ncbi:MAG: hypothetical protein LBD12_05030 [Clostridiales Family XIII bacterium]|nr:hypothetical protein [Clostridiales Family XIII bacterium]
MLVLGSARHLAILPLALLALALLLVLLLGGCRRSEVIEQLIYDQTRQEVDVTQDILDPADAPSDAPIDENLADDTPAEDDSKGERKEVAAAPAEKGTEAKEDAATPEEKPDEQAVTDGEVGGEDEQEDTDEDKPGDNASGTEDDSAGVSDNVNDRPIVDASGKTIDVPSEVNKVAAAGDAALIVQMLGGDGILAAAPSTFLEDAFTKRVFGNALDGAQTLWGGGGEAPMTEANFRRLLEADPDVCVSVAGGGAFSDSQLDRLATQGIAYYTLPKLNTWDNIQLAVQSAGELIGDRSQTKGGIDAPALAREYEAWCGALLKTVNNAAGGRFTYDDIDYNNDIDRNGERKFGGRQTKDGHYTLVLTGWDGKANFVMKHGGRTIFSEKGIAKSTRGYSNSPLSYFLSEAGVCNNGARFRAGSEHAFAALPVNLNTSNNTIQDSGLRIYPTATESFARVWGDGKDIALGDEGFPAIIAASRDIADGIRASRTLWKPHAPITVDKATDFGFLGSGGELITSYVRGDYAVFVNPHGIASWTEGSVESVLEAPWALSRFGGARGEAEVRVDIRSFYETFYRYTPSGSDLDVILRGK